MPAGAGPGRAPGPRCHPAAAGSSPRYGRSARADPRTSARWVRMSSMSGTLVSFHAHPDDEALLVAGTLARAAAEGHRVVLVVATAGEAGLSDDTHSA